ncbi:hypothetical protein FYJ43_11220 [Cutibacterium sp. WCA-380-WT-3A]|uniref:Uncharacterized protein n=1 Tax=Cutibacterium porci TaxID=2605781 RepID=A0A7K0J9T0_9ACTN|nr:hypothetical protein [Cutibacterium porci]
MVPILSSPVRGTHIPPDSSDAVAPKPVEGFYPETAPAQGQGPLSRKTTSSSALWPRRSHPNPCSPKPMENTGCRSPMMRVRPSTRIVSNNRSTSYTGLFLPLPHLGAKRRKRRNCVDMHPFPHWPR